MAANVFPPAPGAPSGVVDEAERAEVSVSFGRRVVVDTVRRAGARVGLSWILVAAFFAVFAPFIANSHPLLMKMGGRWSFPLLRHLTQADVVLLVWVLSVALLSRMKDLTWPRRWGIVAFTIAALMPAVWWADRADIWEMARRSKGMGALVAGAILFTIAVIVVTAMRLHRLRPFRLWLVMVAAMVALLIVFPVSPPKNVVYSQYREWERAGKLEAVYRTIIPYSPSDRMRDVPESRLLPPSKEHWLGTETNGADVLSRIIHASRIALAIGFIATGIALLIGVVVGALMGYFAGWVDIIGMRLIEMIEAVPTLFLLIAFLAFFDRNLYLMMAVIGLVTWTGDARFIRAEFLKLRKQDFVHAAIAAGLPMRSVLFRHMLPNGLTPVLVSASFGVASAILYEATLSFLGLGLVDEPSWGGLLNQAVGVGGTFSWWLALFPGLVIFLTVYAYNLVGEALRDALDPKLRNIR